MAFVASARLRWEVGPLTHPAVDLARVSGRPALFPMPNVEDVRAHLLGQDVIWVWGGSVAGLLSMWRQHGLDTVLREAWEAGVVLTGIFAGSICRHSGGTTDSLRAGAATGGRRARLPPALERRPPRQRSAAPLLHRPIAEGTLPSGYATDGGAGLHYRGTDLHEGPVPRVSTASGGAPTAPPRRRRYGRGCSGRPRRPRTPLIAVADRLSV